LGGEVFALLLACTPPAAAHGLDANRVQVVVHDAVAEIVATPPSAFVASADADGDGLLDVAELRARREDVLRSLVAAVVVTDGDGHPGALDRADVSVPRGLDDGARGSEFLRLTVVLRWPAPPRALRVRLGFVTDHPVLVYATHARSGAQPGVLTLVGDGEYATLDSPASEATLLRAAPAPAPAPPRALGRERRSPAMAVLAAVLTIVALVAVVLRRRRKAL
jgi:hypothetical protein